MFYLIKKMFRDIWNMKAQFIAVLLMSFFAVFMYVGMEGVWYGMLDYADELFEDTSTADAWVSGYTMDSEDVRLVKNIEHVESVQAANTITGEMRYDKKYAKVLLMASDKNELSRPILTDGEEYIPTGDGIWLYEDFAEEHEIGVGDTIKLEYGEHTLSLKVRGLVLSPEYLSYTGSATTITPDHLQYGYGFISLSNMEQLTGVENTFNQLKIVYAEQWDTDKEEYVPLDDKEIEKVRLDIEQTLGNKYVGYTDRSDFKGVSSFTDKFIQVRSMTILFAVLLALLAMLTMQTTMRRMIEIQRIQIGTLKAIGYKDRQIRLHFLFYGFGVSLIGGVIGLVLAPFTISEMLLELQKEFYSSPEWVIRNSWVSFALLAAVVLICSVTALLASKKGTKGMPAITMRDEPPKTKKPIMLERFTELWESLSYEWRWTLRAAARNKTRTIMGIIGIVGSVTLLIDSFGLYDSLRYANGNIYGTQYDYGARITLKASASQDDKDSLLELAHGNAQWMQESSIDIRTSQSRANSVLQIYDAGYFYHFENIDGQRTGLPDDGVAISRMLANDLGIQKNDFVQFRMAGQEKYMTALVKEIITPATPQGIYMTAAFWNELSGDITFNPNVLLVDDDEIVDDVTGYTYVSDAISLKDQLEQADDVLGSVLMIIVLLIVGALLLSIIILYNLGVLSFTERSREYATLKVLGYRDKEIKAFIRYDSLLQLFIGLILGIPAGYAFLNIHIGMASTSSFEYTAHMNPLFIIAALLVISITTFIISAVVSRKALKLNMVEALKSVE